MAKKKADNCGVDRERVVLLVNSVFAAGKTYLQETIKANACIEKATECEIIKENAISEILKELGKGGQANG